MIYCKKRKRKGNINMKKAVKSFVFVMMLAVVMLLLTGCANINYEIKLEKDGSGEISYVMGYDKNFLNSMQVSLEDLKGSNSFDDMKEEASKEGYTIEEYEDNTTYGFKAYKHVENIQNEFKVMEDSTEEDAIRFEKSFFKTSFSQKASLDLADLSGEGQAQDALTSAVMGQMKISYKLVLPFAAGENNASSVSEDGKTLEWTLKAGQVNEINFVAEQTNLVNIAIIAGAIILVLVLILVIASRGKNKKNA